MSGHVLQTTARFTSSIVSLTGTITLGPLRPSSSQLPWGMRRAVRWRKCTCQQRGHLTRTQPQLHQRPCQPCLPAASASPAGQALCGGRGTSPGKAPDGRQRWSPCTQNSHACNIPPAHTASPVSREGLLSDTPLKGITIALGVVLAAGHSHDQVPGEMQRCSPCIDALALWLPAHCTLLPCVLCNFRA